MTKDLIVTAHGWSVIPDVSMIPFSRHLSNTADVVRFTYPNCHKRSISEMAESTLGHIENLQHAYQNIVFVGHSMGAVIGAQVLKEYHIPFAGFVSIAGPLRGSRSNLGGLSFGPSAEDMKNGSDFLNELQTKSPVPSLGLFSAFDPLVSERSATSYCWEKQLIPWTTHTSILFSKRAMTEASAWISYGALDRDPTDDAISSYSYSSLSVSS